MSNACYTKMHFEYKNPSDAERAAHNLSLVLEKEAKKEGANRRYDGYLVCRALFPNLDSDIIPDCASNVTLIETSRDGKTVTMETEDRGSCKAGFWRGVFDAYFPGAKMTYAAVEPDMWIYERWDPDDTLHLGGCVARGSVFGDGWTAMRDRSEFEDILKKADLFEEPDRSSPESFWIHDEEESANDRLMERGDSDRIQAGEWRNIPPEKCVFGTYKETDVIMSRETVWADRETVEKLIAGKTDLDSYLGYDKGGK